MKFLKKIYPIIILLILWTICSGFTSQLFLPTPSSVFNNFKTLILNGMLGEAILRSSYRVFVSTILVCITTIPLGLLMFASKKINNFITPIITIFRYFPGNAFYPLLILWIGISDTMKITFLYLVMFVYFLPSIVLCINEVDRRLIETGYTMGMSKLQVITKIVLPYSLPSICQNIVMMFGMGWTYIPLAEMVNAIAGLGYLINIGSARGRTDMVFTAIISIMIISFLIDSLCNILIRKTFAWKFKQVEVE